MRTAPRFFANYRRLTHSEAHNLAVFESPRPLWKKVIASARSLILKVHPNCATLRYTSGDVVSRPCAEWERSSLQIAPEWVTNSFSKNKNLHAEAFIMLEKYEKPSIKRLLQPCSFVVPLFAPRSLSELLQGQVYKRSHGDSQDERFWIDYNGCRFRHC